MIENPNLDLFFASKINIVFFALTSILLIILLFLKFKNFSKKELKQELWDRTVTWFKIIIFLFVAFNAHKIAFIGAFAFLSFLALKEYLSLIPTRQSDRRVLFWIFLSIPLQYFFVHEYWYGMFIIFIPVYIFIFLPIRLITIGNNEGFLKSLATLYWGTMATVFSISHLAFLGNIKHHTLGSFDARSFVLLIIVLTATNDVFQYISGKLFGKHKISPKVSPGKTWEGFIGGVLLSSLFSLGISTYLCSFPLNHAVIFGATLAIVGFFGDLTESAIKRDIGVKDSGNLLAGHGGILDRIDSLIFTGLIGFHYIWYFFT